MGPAGIEPATKELWAPCSNRWAMGPCAIYCNISHLLWKEDLYALFSRCLNSPWASSKESLFSRKSGRWAIDEKKTDNLTNFPHSLNKVWYNSLSRVSCLYNISLLRPWARTKGSTRTDKRKYREESGLPNFCFVAYYVVDEQQQSIGNNNSEQCYFEELNWAEIYK